MNFNYWHVLRHEYSFYFNTISFNYKFLSLNVCLKAPFLGVLFIKYGLRLLLVFLVDQLIVI